MIVDTVSLNLTTNVEQWYRNGQIAVNGSFYMLRNFTLADKEIVHPARPLRLLKGHVFHIKRGTVSYTIDLVHRSFTAGDVVIVLADTLLEKMGHTQDFEFDAFPFPTDRYDRALANSPGGIVLLPPSEQTHVVVGQHFDLMWQFIHMTPLPVENVQLITQSLLTYMNDHRGLAAAGAGTRGREHTLQRFLALVSKHAGRERNIPFYASQLNVAPHYLSTLIKQASGRTVMEWINRAAVQEIKVWLAHSDDTAAHIAYHLNFSSPSALAKYFRRETGMTPGQYRALAASAPTAAIGDTAPASQSSQPH